MKSKNLYSKLSIISIVSLLTGCAVYEQPIYSDRYGHNSVSTSVLVSNGVSYSSHVYPSYSNGGIVYTTPSPLYFNYYSNRPNPYYRPYYKPNHKPHRPPYPHNGHHGHNGHITRPTPSQPSYKPPSHGRPTHSTPSRPSHNGGHKPR